ncbi:MAG: hypothetical protein JKY94_09975 [Rhodobacteraceae bacterium]|nr:hypothetical protein [Paracoccaceae bacterium]
MKRNIGQNGSGIQCAVLLLGNYRPTMVLVRQMEQRGYRVIAGVEDYDHGVVFSSFVDEIWDHPSLILCPQQFQAELDDLLDRRKDIEIVIPVAEEFVRHFATVKPSLPTNVSLTMSDPSLINICLDKVKMLELAEDCKVPVMPFKIATNLPELLNSVKKLQLPLVVRSLVSTKRLFGQKAVILNNERDLTEHFTDWPLEHSGLLLQCKAGGLRHNVYFSATRGKLCGYLHSRIERTDKLDGSGLAVDGITIQPMKELQVYTSALVGKLNYTGIGCAQFLVEESTGKSIFLEINPRIAGNHAVPEYCGLELGAFLLDMNDFNKADEKKLFYGQTGVRYSWLAGDLRGLKKALRDGEINAIGAFKWACRIVTTFWKSDLDMMINRYDPKPGLVSIFKGIPGIRHLLNRRKTGHRIGPRID